MTEYERHKKELIEKGYLVDQWGRKIKDNNKVNLNNKKARRDNKIFYFIIMLVITITASALKYKPLSEYIKVALDFYINLFK